MSGFSWTLPPVSGAGVAGQDGALDRELGRLFGTDIYFRNDYEITSAGDFLLVSGLTNLREAVYRRLITKPGEYKFVPGYGVGITSYIKRRSNVETLDQLRSAITEQLLRERRIDAVEHVAIERIDDGLKVGIILRAAGRALRFRPFTFTEER